MSLTPKLHHLVTELLESHVLGTTPVASTLREINERLQDGTGSTTRSHEAVQATLLKEAKQRNNILAAENANLRAIATQSPSIEAQKKIIDDLREQLAVSRSRANSQYHQDQETIHLYEELVDEDNKKIARLKEQLRVARETINRYIARHAFLVGDLLLDEQITRLQDYIKNEE